MQIGQPVAKPWTQVHERCRRPVAHAPVAIRSTGHHAFEQCQDAAHTLDLIERCDKMHLRRSRIGEAHVDPTTNQCAYQTFCTIHGLLFLLTACSLLVCTPRRTPWTMPSGLDTRVLTQQDFYLSLNLQDS